MEDESARIPPERPRHSFVGDGTHEVIGAFYEVYNILRFGYLESAYAGAMHVELCDLGIAVEREVPLPVRYKGHVVGMYRADMIVGGSLVLELKSIAEIGPAQRRQLLHYLHTTNMRLGLVLNFGPRAQFQRVINSEATPLIREDSQPDSR